MARVAEVGADAVLITNLSNVSYLTGFSGSSGFVLATPGRAWFMTDSRYETQSAEALGRKTAVMLDVTLRRAALVVAHPLERGGTEQAVRQVHRANSSWFKDLHCAPGFSLLFLVPVELEKKAHKDIREDEKPDREIRVKDGDECRLRHSLALASRQQLID